MRTRERYVEELAETVSLLFEKGENDPSAEEIAEAHFPGKALGGEIVEGIRKRLRRVRDLLEQDYKLPVYLLNRRYYTRYRANPPATEAEAEGCLPGGNRVPAVGLRLHTDENDLIWQGAISRNLVSGAGKLKKSVDRTVDAVEDHRLTEPKAARLLNRAQRHAAPEKPALASKVMQTLPAGGSDDR